MKAPSPKTKMSDTVEKVIAADPALQKIYASLAKELEKLGKVKIEPKKTSIHVKSKSAFAGIHPRKDHLILQIVSEHPLTGKCVFKIEQVSKNRVHNHIRIENPKDVDAKVRTWLKGAYELMA